MPPRTLQSRSLLWLSGLLALGLPGARADVVPAAAFDDPVELLAEGGTGGTAVADLDRDGTMEFVVQRQILILSAAGDDWEVFGPLADPSTRLNRFAGDVAVGDVDGDLWPDIITTDTAFNDTIGSLVWFENPDGDLAGEWVEHVIDSWDGSGTGDEIVHAEEEVGDLDGDGLLDIVVRDISNGFWVFLQDPAGGWHPRSFTPTNPREGLDLWDPDGDGDLDILLNGVWFETPADPVGGSWTRRDILGMEGWYPETNDGDAIKDYATKVVARDFDGDGRDDVLISNAEELNNLSPTKPRGIRLYLQPEDPLSGTWTETILTSDHFSWHSLQAVDIDRDGRLDVLAAISPVGTDTAAPDLSLWINQGEAAGGASFAKVSVDDKPGYQGAVGDADGDGNPEIVLPQDFDAGPVRSYRNIAAIGATGLYSRFRADNELPAGAGGAPDSDSDQLDDLLEFFLVTDPRASTPGTRRPAGIVGPEGLVFQFRRDARVAASEFTVEFSSDLLAFEPVVDGVNGVEFLFDSDFHGPGIDRVSVHLPFSAAPSGRGAGRLLLEEARFLAPLLSSPATAPPDVPGG